MEPGLYVTFLDASEPAGKELPPVGPIDNVVLRSDVLLAERHVVQQAEDIGVSIERWIEAEVELARATGAEPHGARRRSKRFSALDGVYLRFVAFADRAESDVMPEVGPFAVVLVSPRAVEADGELLATRTSGDAPWALTSACGARLEGTRKDDIAIRAANSAHHPALTASARTPVPAAVAADEEIATAEFTESADELAPRADAWTLSSRPRRNAEMYSGGANHVLPTAHRADPPQLETDPPAMRERVGADGSLRGRVGHLPRSAQVRAVAEPSELQWGAALWRTRYLIIGVLLIFVAGYGSFLYLTGTAPTLSLGGGGLTYLGVSQKFSSARFEYLVSAVERASSAGTSRPRGEYLIVRLGVINRTGGTQALMPRDFSLVAPGGVEYAPTGLESGVYQDAGNASSPYVWPSSFAAGETAWFSLVFDVDPSLPRGMILTVTDAPKVRVRLD